MERRRAERFELAVDFCVFEREADGLEFMGRVLNISALGMKIDMTFEEMRDQLRKDDRIVVKRFPECLKDLIGEIPGEIVWVGGDMCGVRFFDPLEDSDGDLREILEQPGLPTEEDIF